MSYGISWKDNADCIYKHSENHTVYNAYLCALHIPCRLRVVQKKKHVSVMCSALMILLLSEGLPCGLQKCCGCGKNPGGGFQKIM